MNDQSTSEGRNPQLWQLAKRRAGFKRHLSAYVVINIFLWATWYFTRGSETDTGFPWPVWTSVGWGIGLAFHYLSAYVTTGTHSVEKEYDKLVQNQNKQ